MNGESRGFGIDSREELSLAVSNSYLWSLKVHPGAGTVSGLIAGPGSCIRKRTLRG